MKLIQCNLILDTYRNKSTGDVFTLTGPGDISNKIKSKWTDKAKQLSTFIEPNLKDMVFKRVIFALHIFV